MAERHVISASPPPPAVRDAQFFNNEIVVILKFDQFVEVLSSLLWFALPVKNISYINVRT